VLASSPIFARADSLYSISAKLLFRLTPWIWYPALRYTRAHFMDSNAYSFELMCIYYNSSLYFHCDSYGATWFCMLLQIHFALDFSSNRRCTEHVFFFCDQSIKWDLEIN